jgi:hypothetical protein
MSNQKTTKRRVFSAEFNRDAVSLIVQQGFSFHREAQRYRRHGQHERLR